MMQLRGKTVVKIYEISVLSLGIRDWKISDISAEFSSKVLMALDIFFIFFMIWKIISVAYYL